MVGDLGVPPPSPLLRRSCNSGGRLPLMIPSCTESASGTDRPTALRRPTVLSDVSSCSRIPDSIAETPSSSPASARHRPEMTSAFGADAQVTFRRLLLGLDHDVQRGGRGLVANPVGGSRRPPGVDDVAATGKCREGGRSRDPARRTRRTATAASASRAGRGPGRPARRRRRAGCGTWDPTGRSPAVVGDGRGCCSRPASTRPVGVVGPMRTAGSSEATGRSPRSTRRSCRVRGSPAAPGPEAVRVEPRSRSRYGDEQRVARPWRRAVVTKRHAGESDSGGDVIGGVLRRLRRMWSAPGSSSTHSSNTRPVTDGEFTG